MTRLDGKRCLVIGAGSGIGRAVFDTFRAEGALVAALELDPAKCADLDAADPDMPVACGDATSWAHTRGAVDAAVEAFGGLDVVVNCVGLFDYYLGLDEIDEADFDAAFDEAMQVNLRSHLISVKTAVGHLRASRGSVVLCCSTSSFAPGRGGILYVASKFALRGAVVSLAHELAPEVRVNGVAPGGTVGTDLRGLHTLGQHDRSLGAAADREAGIRARSPLDVALAASDVAASFVFLASDAALGMTGRFLHPDGGANLPPRLPRSTPPGKVAGRSSKDGVTWAGR